FTLVQLICVCVSSCAQIVPHSFPTRRSSDLYREDQSSKQVAALLGLSDAAVRKRLSRARQALREDLLERSAWRARDRRLRTAASDRKSTRLNSSHVKISYAVFCLKKKKKD